jgi:predicted RNase H-like HicB family nuclease
MKNKVYIFEGGVKMLKRFKVVIEEEPEGGFSAFIPALPGCTSQGETMEEVTSNIKEALELYIWSLKDDGLPIPELDLKIVLEDVEVSI